MYVCVNIYITYNTGISVCVCVRAVETPGPGAALSACEETFRSRIGDQRSIKLRLTERPGELSDTLRPLMMTVISGTLRMSFHICFLYVLLHSDVASVYKLSYD